MKIKENRMGHLEKGADYSNFLLYLIITSLSITLIIMLINLIQLLWTL